MAVLAVAAPDAVAQRRFRVGPTASYVSLDEGSSTNQYTAYGASVAWLTSGDAETGFTVARYGDLSGSTCERSLTFYGLDSYYYPIGAHGIGPFASTQLGLARVLDEDPGLSLPGFPGACTPAEPTSELGLGFGLGFRVDVGDAVVGMVEGRFFQVPNSAIQALEARANLSVAFGSPVQGQFLNGTVGPSVAVWIPVGGPMRGRGPLVGARFRRDSRKSGTVGLDIHYAPLEITEGCAADCEPYAILFAPGYEASLRPAWGRLYGTLGLVLAGFPAEGPDRGMAQGATGGFGADIIAGAVMWNVAARLVWLQRNNQDNVFAVQLGVSVSPPLAATPASAAPEP